MLGARIRFDYSGRNVLVTGGSKGIGKAIVSLLLPAGARVFSIYAKDDLTANQVREEFETYGNRFKLMKLNLLSEDDVHYLLSEVTEFFDHEPFDLVNNAGILDQKPIENISLSDWDSVHNVNLRMPFLLSKSYLNLESNKVTSRSIVNIASVGGQLGGTKAVHYAVSKGGLVTLTRSMSRLGAERGVRCNAVAPGWIETDIFSDEQLDSLTREAMRVVPVGRMGKGSEVANAVLFLLSDGATYITGQCLNVNGGMYLG